MKAYNCDVDLNETFICSFQKLVRKPPTQR